MTESYRIANEPCPECGSRDNVAVYSDGHRHCFTPGCSYHTSADDGPQPRRKMSKMIHADLSMLDGEVKALAKRGITEETCRKWGYKVGKDKHGKTVQIATYCDDGGNPVAQKLRYAGKEFTFIGEPKKAGLYGQHLWRDGGKMVVVTEGEIDALSVSQLQGNKWPVVSIPNGAQGAAKSIAKAMEWLNKFEKVILLFDDDDPGRTAVEEVAGVLPPGKAYVARIPGFKDANEALQAGKGSLVIDAIWGAKEYRLGGIVTIADLREQILQPAKMGEPWPFDVLTTKTYGRRYGELYGFGAGTGIGKTTLFKQLEAFDIERGANVGIFHLEENNVHTLKTLAGVIDGKRYHVPGVVYDPATLNATLDRIEPRVTLFDDSHNVGFTAITDRMRFMRWSFDTRLFYLDHLTALAASIDEDDERRAIDKMMEKLAKLVLDLDCIIHYVSHLTAPDTGKPHEEGGRVLDRHFRGSRAIAYWTHGLYAIEGNKQEPGSPRTFRVLKDRFTGDATGLTFGLRYDTDSGRMVECELSDGLFKDETGDDDDPPF